MSKDTKAKGKTSLIPHPLSPTIHLQDPRWKKALRPYCKTIEAIVNAVIPSEAEGSFFAVTKQDPSASLGMTLAVVLADDAFVQNLNHHYRGKNKPTNVLSFPNDEEPLGDVILAYETVEREAEEQGKTFRDHASHLIIHGILHLMGHDHEDEGEAEEMEKKEVKILRKLGIANPYL